jgi:uncharacterized protein YndB with AHSA1/START domain
MRRIGVGLGVGVMVAAWWSRRVWADWGSTPEERVRAWPGEGSIPAPSSATTLAVSIAAPPEQVWPWLVQIGQDRGGMYSYERLENLFGLGIHNADEVHPEWQSLEPGDRVVVVPPGRLGMPDGYAFPVEQVEAPHHLVLRQAPPEHPWNAVWTFVLEPEDGGSRLVSRSRAERQAGAAGGLADLAGLVMAPVVVLMTRRMLLGIKERAERAVLTGAAGTAGTGEV